MQNPDLNTVGAVEIQDAPHDFLRDNIILFLQRHFSSHSTHQWKGAPQETQIDIIDEWAFNRETVARRPALVVNRGASRHLKLGFRNLRAMDLAKDITDHIGLVETVMRVSCISKLPLESEMLGAQVNNIFKYREFDFLELTGAIDLSVVALNPRSVQFSTSRPEVVDTPVDFTVQFIDRWTHTQDTSDLVLGGFDFTIEVEDP